MTQLQKKPKYRPQPGNENQDALINFELTQQNTLTSWNPNIKKHEFRSKTSDINFHNDDDLVYSDNENEEDYHDELFDKKYSICSSKNKSQKIFSDKISITVDTNQIKNQSPREKGKEDLKLSWFKPEKCRMKTDQDVKRIKQNKSICLLHNKSVFFTNNTKPIQPTIVFRVKPRPDIKQLVQNVRKSERKND